MKKLIVFILFLLTFLGCEHSETQPMVLEYAIYYQDTSVTKKYYFEGVPNKACARVFVGTHWSATYESLYLWYGTHATLDKQILQTTAQIEVIGIYNNE